MDTLSNVFNSLRHLSPLEQTSFDRNIDILKKKTTFNKVSFNCKNLLWNLQDENSHTIIFTTIFLIRKLQINQRKYCITAIDDILAMCCFETISVHALSLLLTVRRALVLVKKVTGLINFFNLRTSEG